MSFFSFKLGKRRDRRSNRPEQRVLWLGGISETLSQAGFPGVRELFWGALFGATMAVCAALIVAVSFGQSHHATGQALTEPIVARVKFAWVDKVATADRKKEASAHEPNVFSPNPAFFNEVRKRFASLVDPASGVTSQLDPDAKAAVELLVMNGQPTPKWKAITDGFLIELANYVVLDTADAADERVPGSKIITEHPEKGPIEVFPATILSINDDNEIKRKAIQALAERWFEKPLRSWVVTSVMSSLKPTYLKNVSASEERKAQRYINEPAVVKTYLANQPIFPVGYKLTTADVDLLNTERETYYNKMEWRATVQAGGRAMVVGCIGLAFWLYILSYNHRITRNPLRGLVITALLLGAQLAAVWLTTSTPGWDYVTAVLPTLTVAMVLAIVYDRRFALAIGCLHGVLVMFSLNLSIEFAFVLLVGVAVAVSQLKDVRTRSTLLVTGTWSGIAMSISLVLAGLAMRPLLHNEPNMSFTEELQTGPFLQIVLDARSVLITGIGVGMVVQCALPFVEKTFRITTAMTLRELNDVSHPLLRRLAQEASGTYQHSLRIADMAEAAAGAIQADSLLCKVGAMYHDIGKINKPLYFVENQAGGPNRHNKLSPAMSLLIIVGHVKDGLEMAREYRIPPTIRQFIETHHGTTLVEYFYHAARQQSQSSDAPAPSEFEFRYPGPKPETKEAAIIMLCDGIEGAARTLPEHTPARFKQLVETISTKRLMDGQFDECGITLQELHKIEESLFKTLCAMYHGRVAYPAPATDALPKSSSQAS